jgi:hypothetical protein
MSAKIQDERRRRRDERKEEIPNAPLIDVHCCFPPIHRSTLLYLNLGLSLPIASVQIVLFPPVG